MSAAGLLVVSNPGLSARRMASFKPSVWGYQFLHYSTPYTKTHSIIMSSSKGLSSGSILDLPESNSILEARRKPKFKPSLWVDQFLHYSSTTDTKAIEAQQEVAKELKEEIYKELVSVRNKPLIEELCLIDSIERIGVAHHFEKEIDDALQRIHETTNTSTSDDLFLTSLRFRLLRQHGFKVSSDVFKGMINSKGSLNEIMVAASDVEGILSLYEACHVRIHGEDILDEALIFTTSRLKLIQEQLKDPLLKEQVIHALEMGVHKRLVLIESLHYIQVYGQFPTHNKKLLRFAKIGFNLIQSVHKKQLSDLAGWWKRIGLSSKLPVRDRIAECYLCGVMVNDPRNPIGTKITAVLCQLMTAIDDLYDTYGTLEELEIFTEAIRRWDKSCLDQLPEGYKEPYQALVFDALEEMEHDLAAKGHSAYVEYLREEMKLVWEICLTEASWRHTKYIPTFDEYMETAVRGSGMLTIIIVSFLDMEMATHEAFQWVCSVPKTVEFASLHFRIMNDIGSPIETDKTRGTHDSLMVASYMRQYEVSYEQACKELLAKADQLWKDMNEAMISPNEVLPMPLFKCMLNQLNIPMLITA